MANVIQSVACTCNNCFGLYKTKISLFEKLSKKELQAFVDANFVRPCDQCGICDWQVDGKRKTKKVPVEYVDEANSLHTA